MNFRTEPRRGGKKIAQGETLGTGRKRNQALKGRDTYYALSGLGVSGTRAPELLDSEDHFLNLYSRFFPFPTL